MKHPEETPVLFGPSSRLFGVLTSPAQTLQAPIACLMFNFGIHTHIGPRRSQVKLARRLALEGIATLRFDLSGVGESPAPDTAVRFEVQAVKDLAAAVDCLEHTLGIKQVAVIGLCSGAGHGLRFSLHDPRVAGLLMFDGYRFASARSNTARRYQRFLRSPWAQSLHWAKRLMGEKAPTDNMLQTNEPETPLTAADFGRHMDTLVARGVAVYLVYSASLQKHDRDHDQLRALRGSPFLQKVSYEFMPSLDHSFTLIAGQQAFFEAASRWMGELAKGQIIAAPARNSTSNDTAMLPRPDAGVRPGQLRFP